MFIVACMLHICYRELSGTNSKFSGKNIYTKLLSLKITSSSFGCQLNVGKFPNLTYLDISGCRDILSIIYCVVFHVLMFSKD